MILSEQPEPVLVIGAGNLLMGDEGVGIHVLRALEQARRLPGVRLLDGGTGGINLLGELETAKNVIFIDATRDGQPEGTLTLLRPGRLTELPPELSAHDFGVKDLFASAALLGQLPEVHVFTISVETLTPMCMNLSAKVAAIVPEAAAQVIDLAESLLSVCATE